MSALFPRELRAINFRSLKDVTIGLRTPNGQRGSGLNLLIGENGAGKTSAIQLLNLVFLNYSAANRLSVEDFADLEKDISAQITMPRFKVKPGSNWQQNEHFECTGIEFSAESRRRKQPNRLISEPFASRTHFDVDEGYRDKHGELLRKANGDLKTFDQRDKSFAADRLIEAKVPVVFLLEKSRARHVGRGQFATTLDRICEELSWRFRKEISDDVLKEDDYQKAFKGLEGSLKNTVPKAFGAEMETALTKFMDRPIGLRTLSYRSPFSQAEIVEIADKPSQDVPAGKLGSGNEMMIALLLQLYLAEHSNDSLLLLIDEPEMHLHPRMQTKLGELLLEKSKSHQIILTSHSPYLVKAVGSAANILQFELCEGATKVNSSINLESKLPWGLSVNEVNSLVFDYPSFEYLNELWGAAMAKFDQTNVAALDNALHLAGLAQDETWKREGHSTRSVTLPTMVRNTIHHPENTMNRAIEEEDIRKAIAQLRRIFS